MPKLRPEVYEQHTALVRQVMNMLPTAGIYKIQEALLQNGIRLAPKYIEKLKRKIKGERVYRVDKKLAAERLAEIEDKIVQVQSKMWEILMNPKTMEETKIKAGEKIINAELKLLEAQMDAGIYERHIGKLGVEASMPELDQNNPRVQAMINLGLIKPNKIVEADVVEHKKLNANNNKTTTNRGGGKPKRA